MPVPLAETRVVALAPAGSLRPLLPLLLLVCCATRMDTDRIGWTFTPEPEGAPLEVFVSPDAPLGLAAVAHGSPFVGLPEDALLIGECLVTSPRTVSWKEALEEAMDEARRIGGQAILLGEGRGSGDGHDSYFWMTVFRYVERGPAPDELVTASYRFARPPGEGWRSANESGADRVELVKRTVPAARLLVVRNVIAPGCGPLTAEAAAAGYRDLEAGSMTMLRVVPTGHDLEVTEEGWRTVEGRRFYLVVFAQAFDAGGERAEVVRDGLVCLHFPEEFPGAPSFYCFVFTQTRPPEGTPPALTEEDVLSVLASFRLRSPGRPGAQGRAERRRKP